MKIPTKSNGVARHLFHRTQSLITLNEGTVGHMCFIEKVLPVALKYDNKVISNDWVFQQDGTKLHQHFLTHE